MTRNKNIYFFSFLFFIIIITAAVLSFPMTAYCNYKVPFIVPLNGNVLLKFRGNYIDTILKTERRHTGIDIEGEPGNKIRASGNGIVSYIGISPIGGRTIVIKHNENIRTTYLNLLQIFVFKGELINQGDSIASIGAEDDPSNSKIHLHFGIIYLDKYLDPEDVLNIDYESISRFLYLKYIESDFRLLRIE
ncbi:MAG: M23 family metallopeptidase [Actinobacteria bacterium]|nr:M23 family metallopeptidase [Actinomycetota bacterium]